MIKQRILIFGSSGMLGQRTIQYYMKKNVELLCSGVEDSFFLDGVDYVQCDITKRDEVKKVINSFFPDVIINCAAFTNVDGCETQRELAWKVNVSAVNYMCEMCRVYDAHLVHISTDYVFDGNSGPYHETDPTNPLGYYGRSKLASENTIKIAGIYHTILRTNVLYGVVTKGRPDFVRWLIDTNRAGQKARIVTDQINNPNFIDDLVQAIAKSVEFKKTGLYHIGGKEFLDRYEFSMKIADFFDLDKSLIEPIVTSELNQAAKRPLRSGLVTLKAETELGYKPHSVEDTFMLMKNELGL